jgi:hypothetical protein
MDNVMFWISIFSFVLGGILIAVNEEKNTMKGIVLMICACGLFLILLAVT